MDRQHWRLVVPRSLRWYSDLLAIDLVVLAVGLSLSISGLTDSPVWILVGLPFVLVAPGYAIVAALYPGVVGDERSGDETRAVRDGVVTRPHIDLVERATMSVGISVVTVPLVGLALSLTPMGISRASAILAVSGLVLCFTAIAAIRRTALPPGERFSLGLEELVAVRGWDYGTKTRSDTVLNVVVVAVLLLSVGSVGYAIAGSNSGESYTELSLTTRDASGNLVADEYPTTLTRGEPRSVVVGIGNHEGRVTSYTVVVVEQRLANDTGSVVEERELRRFQTQVDPDEVEYYQIELTPQMTGDRQRIAYLLYRDGPPENPTVENAYREVHHWVDVLPTEGTTGAGLR